MTTPAWHLLNLEVTVSRRGGPIVVERSSGCPYLVSSKTEDCAVTFKPSPGDELEITLLFRRKATVWRLRYRTVLGGYDKDRLVGAMIHSDVQPYVVGVALVGIILLITSSILAINIARRSGQT